jgi:hypothetical protein
MLSSVRLRLLPLLVLPALLAAPAASQAAKVVSASCVRYTAGAVKYVPIAGAGFTPSANLGVKLNWPGGDLAGYGTTDSTGRFLSRFLGPARLISSKVGFQKTYTLTATDGANPTLADTAKVVFIHAGLLATPLRTRPHDLKTYKFYGFPAHKNIYAHYVFGGKLRKSKFVGKAKGPCGKLRHRMPLIPNDVKSRLGDWKIYFSNKKTFSHKSALLVDKFTIFRTFR